MQEKDQVEMIVLCSALNNMLYAGGTQASVQLEKIFQESWTDDQRVRLTIKMLSNVLEEEDDGTLREKAMRLALARLKEMI